MNEEVKAIRFDVGQCFRALKKQYYLIILFTVIFTCLGILMTQYEIADQYTASATVYSATYGSYSESIQGSYAVYNYSEIVTSNKVCNRAALILGDEYVTADDIAGVIKTTMEEDSLVLWIYATASSPEYSMKIADAVAQSFVLEMNGITGTDTVQILDSSQSFTRSSNGSRKLLIIRMVYVMVGIFLACLIIIIPVLFTKKIISIDSCTSDGKIDILGVLPRF
jgi:capsular polysaccharide biosynthesis protein